MTNTYCQLSGASAKNERMWRVPTIELVDGQALVSLLETLALGLVPRTTFEVDHRFFDEFKT